MNGMSMRKDDSASFLMLIILVGSVRPVTTMGGRIASPIFQKISSAKKRNPVTVALQRLQGCIFLSTHDMIS